MTKKDQNKEKIRQAAYKCVARFGFEKTTLDDIAKEVGLNKASLYYYYKNKEDIFLEVTTAATKRFLEDLKTSTAAVPGTIKAQVRHFLLERAGHYLKLTADIHISEETLRQVEHLFHAQMHEVETQEQQFLQSLLQAAIEKGQIMATDTLLLARSLIFMSIGIKDALRQNQTSPPDAEAARKEMRRYLDLLLPALFRGLRS